MAVQGASRQRQALLRTRGLRPFKVPQRPGLQSPAKRVVFYLRGKEGRALTPSSLSLQDTFTEMPSLYPPVPSHPSNHSNAQYSLAQLQDKDPSTGLPGSRERTRDGLAAPWGSPAHRKAGGPSELGGSTTFWWTTTKARFRPSSPKTGATGLSNHKTRLFHLHRNTGLAFHLPEVPAFCTP